MTGPHIGKLGRLPKRNIPHLKPLRRYLRVEVAKVLPPVPAACDRSGLVTNWGDLLNDTLGDCTIAAVGHAVQLWTTVAGKQRLMTDAEAQAAYELFGYVPGNPATDNGAVVADVLTRWSGPGFTIAGAPDALSGFCAIDPADQAEVRQGVAWLGVVDSGVELPLAAQQMDVWDIPVGQALTGDWAPGSWGGHDVPIVGYSPTGLTGITWGYAKTITWRFWLAYFIEAYGLLSRDFVTGAGSAAAVDWDTLEADMADLKAEVSA